MRLVQKLRTSVWEVMNIWFGLCFTEIVMELQLQRLPPSTLTLRVVIKH